MTTILHEQNVDYSAWPGWRADDLHPAHVEHLRAYMAERTGPADDNGCLPWIGHVSATGYGFASHRISPRTGKRVHYFAHRVAWVLGSGVSLVDDLTVDHLCFNRICMNWQHMERVTAGENARRARERQYGPPLTDEQKRERNRVRARTYNQSRPPKWCPTCNKPVRAKNFARHERNIHGKAAS